jgi:hypothetical protein
MHFRLNGAPLAVWNAKHTPVMSVMMNRLWLPLFDPHDGRRPAAGSPCTRGLLCGYPCKAGHFMTSIPRSRSLTELIDFVP